MELTKEFLQSIPEDQIRFQELLTQWRHQLHAYPETSMEEIWTADFIASILETLGLEVVRNVGGHGIVATLTVGNGPRSIGLRSEMDALNICEETGLPYGLVCKICFCYNVSVK